MNTSVVQSLHLMHSDKVQEQFAAVDGHISKWLADKSLPNDRLIDELYLAAFCRFPDAEEQKFASVLLANADAAAPAEDAAKTRREITEDLLWALLNTAEFVFNH